MADTLKKGTKLNMNNNTMTNAQQILAVVNAAAEKMAELRVMLEDIDRCQSEKSKQILTAAAAKLAERFQEPVTQR